MITLSLGQVTENIAANGQAQTFNVYVIAKRDADGAVIAKKAFTVTSATDLKDQLRPKYQALLEDETRKQQLEAMAAAALAELMAEGAPD